MSVNSAQEPQEMQDMGQLLDSVEPMKPLRRGDIIDGIIMRADNDGVLVNIGHKAEGIVPPGEMRTLGPDGYKAVKVGEEVLAMVIRGETAEGSAILSIDRAAGERGWKVLQNALDNEEVLQGTIMAFNRGGAIVDCAGVQGFVPMSQLSSVSRDSFLNTEDSNTEDSSANKGDVEDEPDEVAGGENNSPDIGRELQMKVLEVNRSRNRAILSERLVFQEQREEVRGKLIEDLRVGEVRKGRVSGISKFGAFVDIGGADGLVHISELSWGPIQGPEEVVAPGQEVDVYVLRVDQETKKIALSIKRLQEEPWETIHERYSTDDIIDATVTKLTDFGAFARVENAIEGLIHISELTERMINHPKDVVGEGDKVRVKILRIEPERRRLGLSLRQADADELTSSDGGRMTGGAALQDSSENRPDIDQAPYVHDNEELQNPINIDAEQFAKDAEPEQDQTVE